ncbi:hypothetical protein [Actinomadura madurae]|nr:hypothetical protein [Actinomadura madurae]
MTVLAATWSPGCPATGANAANLLFPQAILLVKNPPLLMAEA